MDKINEMKLIILSDIIFPFLIDISQVNLLYSSFTQTKGGTSFL